MAFSFLNASPAAILFQRHRGRSRLTTAWKPRRADAGVVAAFCRNRGRHGVLTGWRQHAPAPSDSGAERNRARR